MIKPPRRVSWLHFNVLYPLEALAGILVYGFFRGLGLKAGSAFGGWLGRAIGPWMRVHEIARRNLTRAFPDKTEAEIAAILRGMWDNLGRVLGEWPNLSDIRLYENAAMFEVVGTEYVDQLRDDGREGVCFSAHLGNWEVASLAGTQRGLPLDQVYRAANNPLVEKLYSFARRPVGGEKIPKGAKGARKLLASLKSGRHVAMLVDQKLNDGIPVPFFGRDAMTPPALASLALRFDCPVIPVRVVRLDGPRFRVTVEPPMTAVKTNDQQADVLALMTRVNAKIEGWIREYPEQWLWVHKRWPD